MEFDLVKIVDRIAEVEGATETDKNKCRDAIARRLGYTSGYGGIRQAKHMKRIPEKKLMMWSYEKGVSLEWLLYGRGPTYTYELEEIGEPIYVDEDRLFQVIKTVEEYIISKKMKVSPEVKAEAITVIYGNMGKIGNIDRNLLKLIK